MLPIDPARKVVQPRQLNIEPEPSTRLDRQIDRLRRDEDGGGGGAITHPFQLQDATAGGIAKINVRYGTVQDVEPVDIATDLTLAAGTNYVYLDVEVDINGAIVTVTVTVDTAPQPADEDYHGYITLGNVEVVDDAVTTINQAATHSLRFSMCGRIVTDEVLTVRGDYEFWGF